MDRRLVIKGCDLINTLEGLSTQDLHSLLSEIYPCALYYVQNRKNGYYSIFPSKDYKKLKVESITPRHVTAHGDADIDFDIAFENSSCCPEELFFLIDVIIKYLIPKGFPPNPFFKEHWEKKCADYKSAIASVKSNIKHTYFDKDSHIYRSWIKTRYDDVLSENERICLCVLLRFYIGVPNSELEVEFKISGCKRHKRKAIESVIPKLRAIYPDLPELPCEKGILEHD